MKSFTAILLGLFAALLILTQSVFTMGLAEPCTTGKASNSKKTEIIQNPPFKISYADVAARINISIYLYHWIAKIFTVDLSSIEYHNCKVFSVNPHFFNIYFTYVSALAP